MPAPPYSTGTEMPSRPSSAICGKIVGSNVWARSRSLIRGATSRPAQSRTVCSSKRCSSVSSKSIMASRLGRERVDGVVQGDPASDTSEGRIIVLQPLSAVDPDGGAASQMEKVGGAAAVDGQL